MRRLWWLIGCLLVFATPQCVRAWEIASFDTNVAIHEDATATVTETIVADFHGEWRHGIYRDIPIHYTDRAGQHFTLRLRIQGVTDEAGMPRSYRLESSGRYRRIRIGDPDRTLSGLQSYRIIYDVQRGAIRFFPDHDECYWNLTGNEWAVPIRRVHAEIHLPVASHDLRAVAYVGSYGSTRQLDSVEQLSDHVILEPHESFGPYEGLTAAVAWEKGLVHPPSAWQVVSWWFRDNWVYGLPFLVLVAMTWLWWMKGRDPRLHESQVVQYEPPDGLTPAEVGTLIDERVNLRDITATVIDLAVRGFMRIEPIQTSLLGMSRVSDYRLVSLKSWKDDPHLKPHERDLLDGIFKKPNTSVELSELEQVFYEELPGIRENLYSGLVKAGYLDSNPEDVRTTYIVCGCLLGAGMWFLLYVNQWWHQIPMVAGTIASALSTLIVLAFSQIMPRRTVIGAQAADQVYGFLEFLRRTDQDRIRRINDPSLFERCLPYALAFGVANQWARAFEGIYTKPPTWYAGQWDTFSARRLTYDLNHATASMGHSFTAQPRSSGSSGSWGGGGFGGGGFSGGGGGGGGGGAW